VHWKGIDSGMSLTWSALEKRVARSRRRCVHVRRWREGDRVALIADDDPG